MIINAASLRDLFTGFNTSFNKGFGKAPTHWEKIAMKTVSTGEATNYSWLTDFPGLRKWVGDRVYNDLSAARYVVENIDFELTSRSSATRSKMTSTGFTPSRLKAWAMKLPCIPMTSFTRS